MKKEYLKPAMQVVKIQQQQIICTSSPGAQSLTGTDGFILIDDGLNEDDV